MPGTGDTSPAVPGGNQCEYSPQCSGSEGQGRCGCLQRCESNAFGAVVMKTLFVIVNFAFLVAGLSLVGLGIWVHVFQETMFYTILIQNNPTGPLIVIDRVPMVFIGTGAVITVLGFLGCCGACTDSVCFLGFYATLLIASIIAQVALIVVATTFHQEIEDNIVRSFLYQVRHQYNNTNSSDTTIYKITSVWDQLQQQLNCCGVISPRDYHNSLWINHTSSGSGSFVPQSCCVPPSEPKPDETCEMEGAAYFSMEPTREIYKIMKTKGCHSAFKELLVSYVFPVTGCLFVVDVLQILNLIYSCGLINMVRRKQSDYSWCEDDHDVGD